MAHLDQLREYLLKLDEVALLELLDISSEEIVDRFEDFILARKEELEAEVEIMDSSVEDDELEELNFD